MNQLLLYWFLFVGFGAFAGTLLALATRGVYRKLKEWMEK